MSTTVTIQEAKRIAYELGTRFLKLRRKRSGKPPEEPVLVSKEPIARRIEAELTQELGVSVQEMREAVKFAHAVHKMVATCGPKARKVLLDCRFDAKKIESVARTARPRQVYELGEIAAGRPPLAKPRDGIPVLDTERFSEVCGRLARARGGIQKSLALVQLLPRSSRTTDSDFQRSIRKLDEVIRNSENLRSLVDDYRVVPRKGEKKPTPPKAYAQPESLREACRGNGSALGLIEKNVRDIPRLPKSVKPTGEDVYRIRQELTAITKAAREERRLLKSLGRNVH